MKSIITSKLNVIFITVISMFSCTTVPDEYKVVFTNDLVEAYSLRTSGLSNDWFVDKSFKPSKKLIVDIKPDYYWYYYNSSKLNLIGNIYIYKKYKKINIKEVKIIYKTKEIILIENEDFSIPEIKDKNKLVNKNKEIIIVDNRQYYWLPIKFNKVINSYLINGVIGQELRLKLVQTYSFDDGPIISEEIEYDYIRGGYTLDIIRPFVIFFPP